MGRKDMDKTNMNKAGILDGMVEGIKAEYTGVAGSSTKKQFDTLKDDTISNKEVKGVLVRCGGIVDAIGVIYADGTGTIYGNPKGGAEQRIMLDEGDTIQSISGVYDSKYDGDRAISRLVIETVKGRRFGPFGSWGGREFKLSIPGGGFFAGFIGTAAMTDRHGFVESLGMSYMDSDEELLKGMLGGLDSML